MSRVLVIAASMAQAEDMMRQHATHNYRDIEFRYPANISVKEATLQELYEDCCDVITEEDISAILSSQPSLQLVHSALLFDFPELRGPSFESAFLLLHRYYNKRVVSVDFSPPFNIIDIDDISTETLTNVLEEDAGSTALLIKDIFATEHSLSKRLRTRLPTSRDLTRIKKQLSENGDRIRRFLSDFLQKVKYPLALDPICLIDEDWDPRKRPVTIHYVEGCVTDGIVVPWAISDVLYCRHKPTYLTVVGLPTTLEEDVQMGVWAVFRETLQRLVDSGFNDQFVHAKVAVLKDGSVKVTDMAGCLIADNTALYRHVLNHGDNWRAQMDIGLGDVMSTPRMLPERYAMKVRVVTFANGHEVGDVIDLPKARTMPEVDLFVKKEDAVIKMVDEDDGLHLANIYLFSTNYDRCMELLTEITDEILKKPSSTPPGVTTTTIVSTPASDDDDENMADDDVDAAVITTDVRRRARRGSFFTLPSRYDVEPASTPDSDVSSNLLMIPFTDSPVQPTIPEEPESPGQEATPAADSQPVEGTPTDVTAPADGDSSERSPLQIGNAAANVKVRLAGAPVKQINLNDASTISSRNRKPALNIKLPPVPLRTPGIDPETHQFGSAMILGLGQRLTVEMPGVMKPRLPGKPESGAPVRARVVSHVTAGVLSHVAQKPTPTSMAITGQHGSLRSLTQPSKPPKVSVSDTEPVSYRHVMALREAKESKQRLADAKKTDPRAPPVKDTKVTFADKLLTGHDGDNTARGAERSTRRATIAPDARSTGQLTIGDGDGPRSSSALTPNKRQNNDYKRGGAAGDKKTPARRRQASNSNDRTGSVT